MAAKTTGSGQMAENLLKLLFNATSWSGVGINHTSSPATSLYVSLHSSDPGATGDQTTNEIGYTSYARVAVVRTSSGFTVSGNSVVPAATISFPAGSGGSGTASYFGIGTASSGTGSLWYRGSISPAIVCGASITPQLTTASSISES